MTSALPSDWNFLEGLTENISSQYQIPGLAFGIYHKNQVIYQHYSGFSNIELNSPVSKNTVFALGSCTKAMTAFIIHQLVQSDKLSMDDKVCDHLPDFKLTNQEISSQVTLLDLIAHRTGVKRHDAMWVLNPFPEQELLTRLAYLDSSHGLRTHYLYNNLMYGVLGLVIKQVTGLTWQQNFAKLLVDKLSMTHASFNYQGLQSHPDYAQPYAYYDGKNHVVDFMDLSCVLPAGGFNTNLSDLLLWAASQMNGSATLDADFIEVSQKIHMPFNQPIQEEGELALTGYGMGWFIGEYRKNKLVCHGGSVNGYNADVSIMPEKQLAVVGLTNSSSHGRYALQAIRNAVFDKMLGNDISLPSAPAIDSQPTPNPNLVDLTKYQTVCGQYHNLAYGPLEVELINNRMMLKFGKMKAYLKHEQGLKFTADIEELKMYGAPAEVDVNFYMHDQSDHYAELHIGFEGFRGYSPVVFKRAS